MEQEIIQPIDKEVLKRELTPELQLRMTNKSHNEIYVITAHNAPNVMKEIGRLREIAFREAGGGTGKAMDIDEFDTCENCYKQLIVWNPEEEEIIGGYRYLEGTDWELDEKYWWISLPGGDSLGYGREWTAQTGHESHVPLLREVPQGVYALHHRIGPLVCIATLSEFPYGGKKSFCT